MIQLNGIAIAFGGQPVLDGLTWTVKPGQRIGLIGPNGAGKSTLLRLIAGAGIQDAGTVSISGGNSVGYLPQDTEEHVPERSVLEETLQAFDSVLALQAQADALTEQLAAEKDHSSDRHERLLRDLDRVHTELVTREAHLTRPRSEAVLAGLGFEADELDRLMSTFSGGWRMRVALAKLLLTEPDFLLLDEPTNHLDIVSIDWLEGYLRDYPGTVVIVSHDRYFLDRMVTTVAELSNGKITEFAGNYSHYLEERKHRRVFQQAAYDNQQKQIADTERFIERFRYKASKARQVQSRVKMLEKMERLAPPETSEAEVKIRFPEPRRSGKVVMRLSTFSKRYETADGHIEVFDRAGPLAVQRGDKIALIGKNGAGKSTLARIVFGEETFSGTREIGHNVDITFFAQHQADILDPSLTVLDSLRQEAQGLDETRLRTMLGAFLFTGDDVFKRTGVLSGGERSRLALARTLVHPANFLILDEPTNHLDIKSINVLVEAMRQYAGSFVVVSHDRHFLDRVTNKVWFVGAKGVKVYDGNYSEYRRFVQDDAITEPERSPAEKPARGVEKVRRGGGPKSREQKRREAELRNQRYRELQEADEADPDALTPAQARLLYDRLEKDILEAEEEKASLEAELAEESVYTVPDKARTIAAKFAAVQDRLIALYEEWERLADQVSP